jgi:hypothetical protein
MLTKDHVQFSFFSHLSFFFRLSAAGAERAERFRVETGEPAVVELLPHVGAQQLDRACPQRKVALQ